MSAHDELISLVMKEIGKSCATKIISTVTSLRDEGWDVYDRCDKCGGDAGYHAELNGDFVSMFYKEKYSGDKHKFEIIYRIIIIMNIGESIYYRYVDDNIDRHPRYFRSDRQINAKIANFLKKNSHVFDSDLCVTLCEVNPNSEHELHELLFALPEISKKEMAIYQRERNVINQPTGSPLHIIRHLIINAYKINKYIPEILNQISILISENSGWTSTEIGNKLYISDGNDCIYMETCMHYCGHGTHIVITFGDIFYVRFCEKCVGEPSYCAYEGLNEDTKKSIVFTGGKLSVPNAVYALPKIRKCDIKLATSKSARNCNLIAFLLCQNGCTYKSYASGYRKWKQIIHIR